VGKYILFFFQAEDGIRDFHVTGVQTCALPIYQQSHDDRETGPEDQRLAVSHFGVATNRPVGRNSKVRISTTKETMPACAGLTHKIGRASCRERVETSEGAVPGETTMSEGVDDR